MNDDKYNKVRERLLTIVLNGDNKDAIAAARVLLQFEKNEAAYDDGNDYVSYTFDISDKYTPTPEEMAEVYDNAGMHDKAKECRDKNTLV